MIVFYCNVLPFTSTEWYQQFSWRPRPPALLAPVKVEEITRNLKKYRKKYEQEDRDASNQMTEQERRKRTQLEEEWAAWVAKWKQLNEEDRAHRMELIDPVWIHGLELDWVRLGSSNPKVSKQGGLDASNHPKKTIPSKGCLFGLD